MIIRAICSALSCTRRVTWPPGASAGASAKTSSSSLSLSSWPSMNKLLEGGVSAARPIFPLLDLTGLQTVKTIHAGLYESSIRVRLY